MKERMLCNFAIFFLLVSLIAPLATVHLQFQKEEHKIDLDTFDEDKGI